MHPVLEEYSDFVARVEFHLSPGANNGLAIRYPGHGDPAESGMCEIQILDDTAPKFANLDPRMYHGSALGMVAVQRWHLRPVGEWNSQEVTVQGSKIKVELNGLLILDTDLGQTHEFMQPHPNKDRTSGYFGLTGIDGPVEFREIEIMELNVGGSVRSTAATLKSTRVLFVDDFNDPGSGWPKDTPEESARNAPEHHGYQDGVYRIDANVGGWARSWPCPGRPLPEFVCEVVGRVYGDKPTSRGSLGVHVHSDHGGFQLRINSDNQLFLEPSNWTAKMHPNFPRVGPITHPAIKPGGKDFNTFVLRVKKRQVEILVNSVRVCDPVKFESDLTPARLSLGVFCDVPSIRAEFDRIEIKELSPEPAAGAPTAPPGEPNSRAVRGRDLPEPG
ncbi:MAG: DUF1080 domain-containing protein [Isosphaerales bacterium]